MTSSEMHTVTLQPSGHQFQVEDGETVLAAALRQGFVLPYGCKNGACGSCKGKILAGSVDYGVYQPKALTDEEKAQGKALFCQAKPLSDLVIEARTIGAAKDIQVKKLPCRVQKLEQLADDVMVLQLKLPANERLQFLAGQYIEFLLKDGARRSFSMANRAARRRADRAARAPRGRRAVHRPRVRQDEGARHPALRRAARHLLPARGVGQADRVRRLRHRLRADQGDDRARCSTRASRGR